MLRLSADPKSSPPVQEFAGELLVVMACAALSWWVTTQAHSLAAHPTTSIENLTVLCLSTVLALILWWNLVCIIALRACTTHLLSTRSAAYILSALSRWGSRHTRTIATRHLLHGTAVAAIASTLTIAGAQALPLPGGNSAPHSASSTTQSDILIPTLPVPQLSQQPAASPSLPAPVAPPSALPSPALPSPTLPLPHEPESAPSRDSITIQSGDCLWSIAQTHLNSSDPALVASMVDRIYTLNREVIGDNPNLIYPGMTIHIPSTAQESL